MKNRLIKKKLSINDYKEILITILISFITFLCTCLYLTSPLSKTIPWNDSSGFLYDGKALLSGKTMYVDIFDHKGPLIFVINAFGLLINGLKGVWLLDFISTFTFLLFSYKTIKLFSNRLVGVCSILLLAMFMPYYLDIGNFTETFSLGFIGISLYFFSKYFYNGNQKISVLSSIISGICFMGCILLRPNVAVLWVVFCPVIFFDLIFSKKIKEAFIFLLYFLLGCLIMFLPFAVYFTIYKAWGEFFYQYILLNFVYIDSGGGFFSSRMVECLKFFIKSPAFIISLLPITLLFLPKLYKKIYGNKYVYFISIYVLLVLTLVSTSLSGFHFPHYGIILLPCFIICFGFFLKSIWYIAIENENNAIVKTMILSMMFVIGFIIAKYDNNSYDYMKSKAWIIQNENTRPDLTEFGNLINKNTNPKDGIMIFGSYPELYLVSDRLSSSKYSYQNYWTFSSQEKIVNQVIKDVADEKTKALVIVDVNAYETYTDIANKVQMVLDEEYELALNHYGMYLYFRK
ncbi:MAG: hypothetical protein GX265_05780 [Mollicutes bacterium]|nr:hypothetical protein [Mollicutes bacterium]